MAARVAVAEGAPTARGRMASPVGPTGIVRRVTTGSHDSATGRDTAPLRRWVVIGGALVLVVAGAVLRFVASSPLWLDEALSVNIAELAVSDLPGALRHDGHPALYYLVLGGWIDLFGDTDGAVRALSGVASLVAVAALAAAARLRFGRRVAAHTLVLAATSPFLIRYGAEARMYAAVVAVAALAWWAAEHELRHPARWSWVTLAGATAAAVHLHYWTAWLVASALVVALVAARRGHRAARRVAGAVAVGAASFVVWLPVFVDQLLHTGTPWAERARPAEVVVETIEALGGGMRFEPLTVGLLVAGAALVGASVVEATRRRLVLAPALAPAARPVAAVVVGTLVMGGTAALVTGGAFEARYAAVVVGPVLVLAARATATLPRPAGIVAVAVLAVGGLIVSADEARRDRTQGAEVAAALDAGADAGDVVVFCPDQLGPAVARRLDHTGPVLTYPDGTDPRFVDWYDYPDRIARADPVAFAGRADALAGPNHRVWVVFAPGYRGFEGRCESLIATLGAARTERPVVAPREVFEPMALFAFDPVP